MIWKIPSSYFQVAHSFYIEHDNQGIKLLLASIMLTRQLTNNDLTESGSGSELDSKPGNGEPLVPKAHFSSPELHNSPHPKSFSQSNIIKYRQNGTCASPTKTSCVPTPSPISLRSIANNIAGHVIFVGSARCAAIADRRVAIACAQERATAFTRILLQLKEAPQVKIISPRLEETSMYFSHCQRLKILTRAQTPDYPV